MTRPDLDTRDIRRTFHAARILVTVAEHRLGAALDELARDLDSIDGFPERGDSAGRGRGDTSSTESAVLSRLIGRVTRDPDGHIERRDGPAAQIAEIDDLVFLLHRSVHQLHQALDGTGKLTRSDLSRLRCIGTGDSDGATCTSIADPSRKDGRCSNCGTHVDDRRKKDTEARRQRRHARMG